MRVAHFFGMHALQALPILGWLLGRRGVRGAQRWVQLAGVLFIAGTFLLLFQALSGTPLLRAAG